MPENQEHQHVSQSSLEFPIRKILALLFFLSAQNILFFLPQTALLFGIEIAIWVCFACLTLTRRRWMPMTLLSIGLLFVQLVQLVWRGSPTNHLITFVGMGMLGLVTTYTLIGQSPFIRSLLELLFTPILLLRDYLLATMKSIGVIGSFSWLRHMPAVSGSQLSSRLRSLVVGLIFGLPIVFVLLSMFSSADPVFAKFLQQFGSIQILDQLRERAFWTMVFLFAGVPVLFLNRETEFQSPLQGFKNWSLVSEMTVVMSLVALTLAVFLAVQWPYVFVHLEKETSLSAYGVATYSEYVKKGFEELLRAAVLIFSVTWIGLTVWKNRKDAQKPYLLGVQLVVLAEFGVFLLSLFRRVWLYQSFHGWTLAKIYGVWLLIGLVGMVLTLAARHFWKMKWARVEVAGIVLWLLFASWFNAENFIVQSGHLPTVNDKKDYIYLSRMTSDGVHGWILSYEWAKNVLETQLARKIEKYDPADRQQIAYAARVVAELSDSSKKLVFSQGSTEEVTQFYQESLSALELELRSNSEQISQLLAPVREMRVKNKTLPQELINQEAGLQKELSEKISSLQSIGVMRNALAESPIDWQKVWKINDQST